MLLVSTKNMCTKSTLTIHRAYHCITKKSVFFPAFMMRVYSSLSYCCKRYRYTCKIKVFIIINVRFKC